jgi:hypothetical protein
MRLGVSESFALVLTVDIKILLFPLNEGSFVSFFRPI